MYIDFSNKKTFNKNYKKIFKKTKNYKKAEKILRNAYLKINQAPIYTIHGFCKNILIKKNLNYEYSFSEKKIYDENYLYKKSTYNFWRNTFYQFNKKISNIVIKYWKTPNDLFQEILPWLKIKSKISIYIKKKKKNIIEIHQNNIKKIKNFKKKWKKNKKNIQKFFQRKNLNKRIYNKKNIQKWIKKIEKWRKKKTKNYFIPKELKHFKNKKINKNLKEKIKTKFKFFKNIEKFLKKNFSLRERILFYSIKKIKKIFIQISKKKFCFENLISSLNLELKKRKNLKKDLRKEFPIAFIDEFQDTDNKQYSIFKKIYKKKKNTSLILIGDPKQSIYNFRGADIFFYIKNKKKISNIYTLKTNWRSSKLLINGINKLFNRTKNIFLFKEIKYNLTIPSVYSDKIKFYIKNLEQKAIKFWLQKGKTNTISNYENWAAKICSQNINYLIQKIKKKQAILQNSNKKKFLKIKDICILVKNYKEFKKIQYELKKLNIGSYYTSYKKSIFKKNEVQEMYYILKSIVNLSNEYYFYRAISTLIIFKNSYIIYKIKKKYNIWSKLKNKFINYKKFWKKYGILNLIKEILSKSNIYKNYFFNNKNERKISNLIHLGEILEIKSKLRKNFCSLLLWFKKKIKKENEHNEQYYQKLSNNQKNIINITTIHKSKGLEYPIVWIPFISNFKFSKKYIFHNKKKYNCFINIEKLKKYIKFEEKERLSEDMRLLYVAMTRAIFQCNLGISPIIKKIKKKSKDKETDFHNSAIGYIIQKKKKMNSKKLKKEIIKITKEKNFELIKKIKIKKKKKEIKKKITIKIKNFKRKFKKYENTSYTKIKNTIFKFKKKKSKKENKKINKKKIQSNQYNFPKGKKYGKFLHEILEKIDFKKKIKKSYILKKMKKINLSKKWLLILIKWINKILINPLNSKKLNLINLKKNSYVKELKFYLPIKKKINIFYIRNLSKIIKKKNKNGEKFKIKIKKNKGILSGSIDLIIKKNNKYYLIDYKSNFLGKNINFYNKIYLKKIIIKEKYDLQYYIYSIALHRFLKRKKKYNFKKNFGGIYYLFLRGMNGKNYKNGIFFYRPKYSLIKKINNKFFKKPKI